MNIFELSKKLKGQELDLNQFNFNFIPDFVPQKVVFTGISLKEGFPGNINGDFLIEGYIKGFDEFPVKAFRRLNLFKDGENVFEIFELNNLDEAFEYEEIVDLEKKGIIDSKKNIIFLNKVEIEPIEFLNNIKQLDKDKKIEKFISLTEELINEKIKLKIFKFLNNSKSKEEIKIPDELRDFVSPNGTLIEPKSSKPYSPKPKPLLDISIRGISRIPSINSVIKKVEQGKKLNFIENVINSELNKYLSKDIDLNISIKNANDNILKTSYFRESLRKELLNENISNISFKGKVKIINSEFETKITINNKNLEKEKDSPVI